MLRAALADICEIEYKPSFELMSVQS